MNGHSRLPDWLGRLVLRYRLYEPLRALAVLLALMAARSLFDSVFTAFSGASEAGMFPDTADRYADLVKVALSYRPFVQDIVHSRAWHGWSPLFQGYLFSDDYTNTLANLTDLHAIHPSVFHMAPMATLIYLGVARAIAAIGPGWMVCAFIATYSLGAICIARWQGRETGGDAHARLVVIALYCCSYPALFMLTRSNLAGFVGLLDGIYLLSLRSGRGRWAGWLALALAVNLRPEPALLALMEVLGKDGMARKIMRMAIPGVLTLLLAGLSYGIVHELYPDYTLDHMRQGLALYDRLYAQGQMGDGWNVSLQMLVKALGQMAGAAPWLNRTLRLACVGLAGLTLLYGVWLASRNRIGWNQWLFVLCAIPALALPVHAYYHMIRFIPVALWLMHDLAINASRQDGPDLRGSAPGLLALTGLAMSPLLNGVGQGLVTALILIIGSDAALFPARTTR